MLSAALASNNSEPSTSEVPNTVSTDEGSSSSTNQGRSSSAAVPSPSIDTNDQSPDAIDAVSDTVKKNKGRDCRVEVHIITYIYSPIKFFSIGKLHKYMMILLFFGINRRKITI